MPTCAPTSNGSVAAARRKADEAMKAIVEQEKIRYAQHKKLRDLLSKKIGTVCSFFEVIDKDHNGQVSRSEFHEGMEALGLQDPGFNMPPHIYDELFDEFDMDGSGEISYKEYFQYVLRDSIRRKANLFRDFFIRSDVSGDGQIDKAEFRAAVMLLHGQHGHEMEIAAHVADVDEVFDDMDVNGSGSLTLNELHRQLRCSVGMGKFVRAKAKRDGSVVQRKASNAKLRGSLRDQFLFHNPNKAYFGHSLEHVEKYVERTAVAQAAYSLAVDTRLDKHLDSGDRVSLGRAAASRVPGLYLFSSDVECAPRTPRRLPSALETVDFETDEGAAHESHSSQMQRRQQPQRQQPQPHKQPQQPQPQPVQPPLHSPRGGRSAQPPTPARNMTPAPPPPNVAAFAALTAPHSARSGFRLPRAHALSVWTKETAVPDSDFTPSDLSVDAVVSAVNWCAGAPDGGAALISRRLEASRGTSGGHCWSNPWSGGGVRGGGDGAGVGGGGAGDGGVGGGGGGENTGSDGFPPSSWLMSPRTPSSSFRTPFRPPVTTPAGIETPPSRGPATAGTATGTATGHLSGAPGAAAASPRTSGVATAAATPPRTPRPPLLRAPPPLSTATPGLSAMSIEPSPTLTTTARRGQSLLGPLWPEGRPPWTAPTATRAAAGSTVVSGAATLALRQSALARVDAPADFIVGDNIADRRRQALPEMVEMAAIRQYLRDDDPKTSNPFNNGAPAWGRTGTSPRWQRPHLEIDGTGEPRYVMVAK